MDVLHFDNLTFRGSLKKNCLIIGFQILFQLSDPNHKRYEVPIDTPKVTTKAVATDYQVNIQQKPFGITVLRKSTATVL